MNSSMILFINRVYEIVHPIFFVVANLILCAAFYRLSHTCRFKKPVTLLALGSAIFIPSNIIIFLFNIVSVGLVPSLIHIYGKVLLSIQILCSTVGIILYLYGGILLLITSHHDEEISPQLNPPKR
jgi:hypothetical protein